MIAVCTSREETQHLAGIEAAACGLPVVSTPVGVWADLAPGPWGRLADPGDLPAAVREVLDSAEGFSPRAALEPLFGLDACRRGWLSVLSEVLS